MQQSHPTSRNVPTPQERAEICEAIRRELALEYFERSNSRREAWARIVIGLKPFPRTLHWGQWR